MSTSRSAYAPPSASSSSLPGAHPFAFGRLALAAACAALVAACGTAPDRLDAAHPHGHAHGQTHTPGMAHDGPPGAMPAPAQPTGPAAVARLTTPDGKPAGRATLTEVAGGVEVAIDAQGLTSGLHGLHVHVNGACAPGPDAATGQVVPFGAAGGHFDPGASRNHGRPGQPMAEAHAGELPNLTAGADGRAVLRYTNANLAVAPGKTSVMGRTVVVHAQRDDYETDPAGDSGGRVLCGVIEPAQPSAIVGRTTIEGSNVFPEGIAFDPRTGMTYVGSSAEGHIYRIAPGATMAEKVQTGGSPGRQAAYGLKVDGNGRLWIAGGTNGTVTVVDLQTSATLAVVKTPPGTYPFVNDIAPTRDGTAYVTDSFRPVVYRVRVAPGAPLALEPWLDLRQTAVRYVPNEVNFNGIVASADGRWLLAVQSATGELWRIDTRTKAVTALRVEGGDLKGGDGLVLRDATDLYLVRNSSNEVVRLALANDWSSAKVTQRLTDPRLKYPTTAVITPQGLVVVNGQTDKQKSPPPLLPFDVVTIGLPAR